MKERLRGSGKSVILAESSLPETTCLRRQEAMSQQATLHRYEGRGGTVTYDVKRCVHAGECSRRLPAVFDSKARALDQPGRCRYQRSGRRRRALSERRAPHRAPGWRCRGDPRQEHRHADGRRPDVRARRSCGDGAGLERRAFRHANGALSLRRVEEQAVLRPQPREGRLRGRRHVARARKTRRCHGGRAPPDSGAPQRSADADGAAHRHRDERALGLRRDDVPLPVRRVSQQAVLRRRAHEDRIRRLDAACRRTLPASSWE